MKIAASPLMAFNTPSIIIITAPNAIQPTQPVAWEAPTP